MLPATGVLSLSAVRTEIRTTKDMISLSDYDVRKLAGRMTGMISFSDLRGKALPEVHILKFKITGDQGGKFKADTCFYRNSDAVVMTSMQLIEASKYEQRIRIESTNYNIEFTDYVKHSITPRWKSNQTYIVVPGSADHWIGNFYGKVYNQHMENRNWSFTPKYYHNNKEVAAF